MNACSKPRTRRATAVDRYPQVPQRGMARYLDAGGNTGVGHRRLCHVKTLPFKIVAGSHHSTGQPKEGKG